MPTPAEILEGLARISRDAFPFAVAWHALVAALLAAVVAGWRPTKRLASLLLAAPIVSASAFAWATGNPFNGAVLAAVAAATIVTARHTSTEPLAPAPAWAVAAGTALVAFAWSYPHFLEGVSRFAYLYGAPMGLIPCPSLALAIGFSLIAGSPAGRGQAAVLSAAGAAYALFGAFRLGVLLDLVLLAGAVALAASTSVRVHRGAPQPAR
jgi:hypothetical protein